MDNKTKYLCVAIAVLLASNGYLLYRLGNAEGKSQPVAHTLRAGKYGSNEEAKPTAKPAKELTAEEKVVGAYEAKVGEETIRMVFLENGVVEGYANGKKHVASFFFAGIPLMGGKWSISKEGELRFIGEDGDMAVFRINTKGNLGISHVSSITPIAHIPNDGKRIDYPKEDQDTFIKIK